MNKPVITETTKQQLLTLASELEATVREGQKHRKALRDAFRAKAEAAFKASPAHDFSDKYGNNVSSLEFSAAAIRMIVPELSDPLKLGNLEDALESVANWRIDKSDKPGRVGETRLQAMQRVASAVEQFLDGTTHPFRDGELATLKEHAAGMKAAIAKLPGHSEEAGRLLSIISQKGRERG